MPLLKYIIVHSEHGVYVGNFIGLSFWSKLDPAGQISAPTFPSIDDATAHVRAWDCGSDFKNELTFEGVETLQDYVDKETILEHW